jgi:hypothetical protein
MPKLSPQQWWHGHASSQEERDRLAQDMFDSALRGEQDDYHCTVTGDVLVLAVRHGDVITVSDCILRRRTRYKLDGQEANEGTCRRHKE